MVLVLVLGLILILILILDVLILILILGLILILILDVLILVLGLGLGLGPKVGNGKACPKVGPTVLILDLLLVVVGIAAGAVASEESSFSVPQDDVAEETGIGVFLDGLEARTGTRGGAGVDGGVRTKRGDSGEDKNGGGQTHLLAGCRESMLRFYCQGGRLQFEPMVKL